MVRDTTEGKTNFLSCRFGPMFRRWNEHLTKGREKYPDPQPGVPNWTLAEGEAELLRARESAARHFEQWLAGDTDEDHAAAVYFNVNLAEYVREKMTTPGAMFEVVPGHPVPVLVPPRDMRTSRDYEIKPCRPWRRCCWGTPADCKCVS